MANASLKHFKLGSSKGSATDSDCSEDDETEGSQSPGGIKCEVETELNIAQFVKAELLYDFEDSDSGDEREEREDQDWVSKARRTFSKSAFLRSHIKSHMNEGGPS